MADRIRIVRQKCSLHEGSQCMVRVVSFEVQDQTNQFVQIPPFCVRQFLTKKDYFAHIYSQLSSKYRLTTTEVGIVLERHEDLNRLLVPWFREYYKPESQTSLKPMTGHPNSAMLTDTQLAPFVPSIARRVDQSIHFHLGMTYRPPPVAMKGIRSLQDLLRPRTSVESILTETVTVGGKPYPLFYYSTNPTGQDSMKTINLMKEFSFNAAQRGVSYHQMRKWITPALRNLEYVLRCDDYVGKLDFFYSPTMTHRFIKMRTSGGILDTPSISVNYGDDKIRIANAGSKIYLFEAAARELHALIIQISRHQDVLFQPYNVTKLKGEFRLLYEKDFAKLPEALNKCREFFIPSLTLTLLAELLHKHRMLIERGEVIQIGCTPWYGGWQQIAEAMNYNQDNLFWVDGDITGLDKHITDWMLYLYLASGSRYYNWKGMNGQQRRLLRQLYKLLMYHVTNKITLQPGTIWRLIIGVMYSGGKETSHGDSWIMALIFFLYIEYTKAMYPDSAPFIQSCLLANFIAIIVYGDDHIWCCPISLRGIINVMAWAKFLKDFLGMELRDYREYTKFLSVVDITTGSFVYKGPKFLKRYFIASYIPDTCAVLPYKPFLESVIRMCLVTEADGYPGLLLKTIGQAWDTMGTNPVAYAVCRDVYEYARTQCDQTPREIYLEWKNDPKKTAILRSMIKKVNMTHDEFFDSFPEIEHLRSRHRFDPTRNSNRPVLLMM